jgi:hypothetical protein
VNVVVPALGSIATTLSPSVGVPPAGSDPDSDPGSFDARSGHGGSSLVVFPAWPNPVGERTRLSFSIPRAGVVSIAIFDVGGREAARLGGAYAAGAWSIDWDTRTASGDPLPAGLYLARFEFEGATETTKLVVLH